jgi:hypothetical protein
VAIKKSISSHKLILFVSFLFLSGCGNVSTNHWSEFTPDSTPFVIIPEEGAGIDDMLNAPYIPLFDDITPSAIQLITQLEGSSESSLEIDAILLFPDLANDWQPIWISKKKSGLLSHLKRNYQPQFEQTRYRFKRHTIEKLFISEREFFVVELGNWMVFSESSIGIESILRTLEGEEPAMALTSDHLVPGSFVMNTTSVEKWVQQVAQVLHRPNLINIFEGGTPVSFRFNNSENAEWQWQLQGSMALKENRSVLMRNLSQQPREFTLDRYISINTSGFGIMWSEPRRVPIEGLEAQNETDIYIEQNPDIWENIASQIDSELAFATFAESGAASTSEYLYLRKITNAGAIRTELNRLREAGLAIRDGNTYSVNSRWLAKLFGSEINPLSDFYVTIFSDVAALSLRKGLAEGVASDANRRRVVYYDDDYSEIKNSLPSNLSSIFYVDASRFGTYIQPWLYPQNYFNNLISGLDQFVITTERSSNGSELLVNFTSFERESVDQPFRENWIFPLGGAEITGKPVLADLTGSNRDEVVFSTKNGSVFVLASDGTTVLQISTEGDTPIGSPVVYDWYGNNQNVIMQAAGSRIYAWNSNGTLLPNFPINMSESITTPLTVMDITRNGVAEIIISTSDRRIHILNARGQAINGWPRSTNAVVSSLPLIAEINGQRSIFAFAENTLHAWEINGNSRSGYPVFLPGQMSGSPAKYREHIIGAGLDGGLYSIGLQPLFSDTLSSTHASDSVYVQSLQVSNSSLNTTPSSHSVLMRDEDGFYREEMILTQSGNGSIFLYNSDGILRFTKTMGQPSSPEFSPIIADLDRNNRSDIVALADFGRMYAWDILSGSRLLDLPTTGLKHMIIQDISGNGNNEIVAHTRDGLRSWTIVSTRREETSD